VWGSYPSISLTAKEFAALLEPSPLQISRTSVSELQLLAIAHERLDDTSDSKLPDDIGSGDQHGEVRTGWHTPGTYCAPIAPSGATTALEFVTRLGLNLQADTCPREVPAPAGSVVGTGRVSLAAVVALDVGRHPH